ESAACFRPRPLQPGEGGRGRKHAGEDTAGEGPSPCLPMGVRISRPWPATPRRPPPGGVAGARQRGGGGPPAARGFCPCPCPNADWGALGVADRQPAGSGGPGLADASGPAPGAAPACARRPTRRRPRQRVLWAGSGRPRPGYAGRLPPTGSNAAATIPTPAPPGSASALRPEPPKGSPPVAGPGGRRPARSRHRLGAVCTSERPSPAAPSQQRERSCLTSFLAAQGLTQLAQALIQWRGARRRRLLVAGAFLAADHALRTDRLGQNGLRRRG